MPLLHDEQARSEWNDATFIQISESLTGHAIRTRDWIYCVANFSGDVGKPAADVYTSARRTTCATIRRSSSTSRLSGIPHKSRRTEGATHSAYRRRGRERTRHPQRRPLSVKANARGKSLGRSPTSHFLSCRLSATSVELLDDGPATACPRSSLPAPAAHRCSPSAH